MILEINHHTTYRYASEVSLSPHYIRLRPREDMFSRLHHFAMKVRPEGYVHWIRDPSDCPQARIFFPGATSDLSLDITMTVENVVRKPFDFLLEPHAATFPFVYSEAEAAILDPWLRPRTTDPENRLRRWLTDRTPPDGGGTVSFLFDLNRMIHESFDYRRRELHGVQSPGETLDKGVGTCRDFAWLMAEGCRKLGLAARLAGGYMYVPGEGKIESGDPDSTLHAWTEVYLPGGGWRGVDPTNGVFCDEHYITTVTGPTPDSITAMQGSYYHHTPVKSILHSVLNIEERSEPRQP